MSLLKAENRQRFLADERAYLEAWGGLSEEQMRAVTERDWIGMIKSGGNIYYIAKLIGTDQQTFQYVAGRMCGMEEADYRRMMVEGGRPAEGNRSKAEWPDGENDNG